MGYQMGLSGVASDGDVGFGVGGARCRRVQKRVRLGGGRF
jgi:hypothetical protein